MERRSLDPNLLLILAGLGAAGFALYKVIQFAKNPNKGTPYEGGGLPGTVANVLNQASGNILAAGGSLIGMKLYDWIGKEPRTVGTVYNVAFPDGTRHGVADTAINGKGQFMTGGTNGVPAKWYVLKVDDQGRRYAVPL